VPEGQLSNFAPFAPPHHHYHYLRREQQQAETYWVGAYDDEGDEKVLHTEMHTATYWGLGSMESRWIMGRRERNFHQLGLRGVEEFACSRH